MAVKPQQRASINQFTGGLITEANPLEYPDGASFNELNMDMDLTGLRFRRLGMAIEPNGVLVSSATPWADRDSLEYNTYLWKQVSGEPGLDLMCVQIGNQILFFKPGELTVSLTGYVGESSIPGFPANKRFFMTALDGFLVLVCGDEHIAIIEYFPDTTSFVLTLDRLRIRDVFGVQETLNPAFEADQSLRGPLNQQHYYNLNNQGWGIPRWDWVRWGNSLQDPVFLAGNKGLAVSPSNADVVWSGVDFRSIGEDDDGQPNNVEAFNYQQFVGVTGADVAAAKGYFIIDALDRGQSRIVEWNKNKDKYLQVGRLLSEEFNPPLDKTSGGPSCVAAHAGRVFYSGFTGFVVDGDTRSPNYNNHVFFSQVVKNKADFNKCYQAGDPTSRETSDIIDTDGGFLKISGANTILSLVTVGSRLIVIADNGIWAIVGGSDYGFSATNYRVDKLSTFGGLSDYSVVVAGENVYYWAADGIYVIGQNEMGDYSVQNVTNTTIKSFYAEIPTEAKRQALGVYDIYSKRIRWMYRNNDNFSETTETNELILDTQLQCFIPFKVKTLPGYDYLLIGGVETSPFDTTTEVNDVISEDELVVTTLGDQVIMDKQIRLLSGAAIKYVGVSQTGDNIGIFFSRYTDPEFRDWKVVDNVGVDAYAFVETGQSTIGDVAINKQIPYLTMVFENTEKQIVELKVDQESSCIGRVQWDFGTNAKSNKWSREMQLYRKNRFVFPDIDGNIDNGFSKVITKSKLRGGGKSFALHFHTEEWKDLKIRGWVLTVTANGVT